MPTPDVAISLPAAAQGGPPVSAAAPALPLPAHALEWLLLMLLLAAALYFRPWASLRQRSLHHPWLASLVILPWLWNTRHLMPGGLNLQLSGACLLVMMFGWPLAAATLLPVGLIAALLGQPPFSADAVVQEVLWSGLVPATLALGVGALTRSLLPPHLFVYILGRGFIGTALAMMLTALVEVMLGRLPPNVMPSDLLLARWLMAWGEAFATGMLSAIFVAFAPGWLLTYSDQRYLPPPA